MLVLSPLRRCEELDTVQLLKSDLYTVAAVN